MLWTRQVSSDWTVMLCLYVCLLVVGLGLVVYALNLSSIIGTSAYSMPAFLVCSEGVYWQLPDLALEL